MSVNVGKQAAVVDLRSMGHEELPLECSLECKGAQ